MKVELKGSAGRDTEGLGKLITKFSADIK